MHTCPPKGCNSLEDAALGLIASAAVEVWPLEEADVALARRLHERHPALQARDLCHLRQLSQTRRPRDQDL